ncbi:hypothetical protein GCM10010168_22440 [Actinoplanes ianthinogenes]|uniref:Uncharacterized protein n=1 Tax=Actinoplanes ianthinogenes TaxID=122358 RepID=A0ABN6CRZ0_9ACTN|nr:hypothetical protein [Actinoplanes ianthinogenes]BCJ47885.1 hypothetical protein Aiant_85420 [Actinoplanes ianthinogenes]GGR04831.1 hypothetical protein GCM10010168_22440 [Actinoplanes ianthinogenes]
MLPSESVTTALADLAGDGGEPRTLREEAVVTRFADILGWGWYSWRLAADAVAAGDFGAADEILRTKLTFTRADGNPYLWEFRKDVRLAEDSRKFGQWVASDGFTLAFAPVVEALRKAGAQAHEAISAVRSGDAELARLRERAAAGGSARTAWGARRLERKAAAAESRIAELSDERPERVARAQRIVAGFVADVAVAAARFEAAFQVDCHRAPPTENAA